MKIPQTSWGNMIYLVGGNGLVGYAFQKYFKKNKIKYLNIQRQTQYTFAGKSCDLLIYANGNANKTLAEKDPEYDFENTLGSILFYLRKIKFKKFIFFSSVDVYRDTTKKIKTSEKNLVFNNSVYGMNKVISEMYVRKFAKNFLIFRLGGLVGDKLKKNPIYDIFNRNKVFTSTRSEMNFIHTDYIPEILFKLEKKKIRNEIFNLASKNDVSLNNVIRSYAIKKLKKIKKYKDIYQVYKINVNKILKYVELPKTEDSIKKYLLDLNNKTNT